MRLSVDANADDGVHSTGEDAQYVLLFLSGVLDEGEVIRRCTANLYRCSRYAIVRARCAWMS